MPDLYILEQMKRNTSRAIDYLFQTLTNGWASIDKFSTKFANGFNKEVVGRIIRKAHKHKKCLRIFSIILAIFALIIGLFMGSFKSAGSRQQGFQINYTEEVFKENYLTNDWKYTGLNGYIKTVPKQKIFIEFSKNKASPQEQQENYQLYEAIEARVVQGTRLIVEASFECTIVIQDNKEKHMKLFFDMYGFRQTPGKQSEKQWMTYLRHKTANLIVQTVGKESFYSITVKELKQSINSQLAQVYKNFNASFPFKISVLSLAINYPENSFSAINTLGSELMRSKSSLNQLSNQYETVQKYIEENTFLIQEVYKKNARLTSQIERRILDIYSYEGWTRGLNMVKMITDNSTSPFNQISSSLRMEKFLWLYFNNLYNSTYKQERKDSPLNL